MYEIRSYRNSSRSEGLIKFTVAVKETDLFISADKELIKEATESIKKYRKLIEEYIVLKDPLFQKTLQPRLVSEDAPLIVKEMAWAGIKAQVGPMAAVAGVIAEYTGKDLLNYSTEVIIENGGDIFISCRKRRKVGIFAGASVFSNKLALEIYPEETPLGICTSSATVGPSLSFGEADAAVVISKSTALADAMATRIGNMVSKEIDLNEIRKVVENIKEIKGILVIKKSKLGVFGDIRLIKI
ncbi:UPF0280 family protein [bacterium]|nr:UPF0280 family protein [bacterium]MBU1153198.1 UPF0280 family protein [bacterium]MBU2599939.1 UPF0280 family protein [bacterium]